MLFNLEFENLFTYLLSNCVYGIELLHDIANPDVQITYTTCCIMKSLFYKFYLTVECSAEMPLHINLGYFKHRF